MMYYELCIYSFMPDLHVCMCVYQVLISRLQDPSSSLVQNLRADPTFAASVSSNSAVFQVHFFDYFSQLFYLFYFCCQNLFLCLISSFCLIHCCNTSH
jgi:hypothetical protein